MGAEQIESAPRPLEGIRILDFSTLAAPWASMLLAAYGADVIAVESPRPAFDDTLRSAGFGRGKRSIVMDLKSPGAIDLALQMISKCDVVIEAMRPGKMEELGLGPDIVHKVSPQTVYARFSNFGHSGPLHQKGGHDINAIALGGALSLVGLDQPLPPASMLGDWASGGLPLVIGILLALIERTKTGRGQVVDAAMSDGAAMLAGPALEMFKKGVGGPRGTNLLDGSRPYYTTYRCADGKWLAVGAIEHKFFSALVTALGLDHAINADDQYRWSLEQAENTRATIASRIAEKKRDEWLTLFEDVDACVTPVLEIDEACYHPHNKCRQSFVQGINGPSSSFAPRLSGRPFAIDQDVPERGRNSIEVLKEFGFSNAQIEGIIATEIVSPAASSA